MDITLPDLWSAWPSCSLCNLQLFSQDDLPYQLDCLHLFCQRCICELWQQDSYYYCPFDGGATYSPHYNYDLVTRMNEIYQWGESLPKQMIAGHFYWLKQKINTANVPCRSNFVTNSCYAKNCCNSHTPTTWQGYNCPHWDNCIRGHMCPYKHSWTQVNIYQTVTPASFYSSAAPVVLQQMLASDPQVYSGGNYQYDNLTSVTSTVQAMQCLSQQKVIIRSCSLLNLLTSNNSQVLNCIATNYGAQFNLTISQVRYMTNVRWVYYQDGRELNYNEYVSCQLEEALKNKREDLLIGQDARVNFKVMVHVTANHYYKIHRYEIVTSSTDAGTIEFAIYSGDPQSFFQEITQYEISYPSQAYAPCKDFVAICKKFGLGVIGEKMYGTNNDLQNAMAEMQAVLFRQSVDIQCQPLPVGVDKVTAEMISKVIDIAVYGDRVFGDSQNLMLFMQQIHTEYMSIPVPAGMTEALIANLCVRHNLTRQNQLLFGKKECIAQALSQMTESSIPIPPGTTDAKIQEVVLQFSLRREGNTLTGSRDSVIAALQTLQNLEMSAAYPKSLLAPKVQEVCQKHHVRAENDKIFGTQANVLAALNELNTIVPAGPFQYHRPPQWYLTNAADLVVVDLPQTDPEYTAISNKFHVTSANQITRIRVVQNKRMYTNFAFKHEGYSKVEGRAVEIKRLFHGTRANDPKVIYESDAGLDSRLGGGMWGNGTYYALNSSYSVGYAHPAADGTMEMFLCEVLVGDFKQVNADNTLKKPPQKPNSNSLYHSVKGNTGGSDIWITYEPAMSYPHFIINFR